MFSQESECGRCEATIISNEYGRDTRNIGVTIDGEDGQTIHFEERELCRPCREDFLEWVDGDYSRKRSADLPEIESAADGIENAADDLREVVEKLRDVTEPDGE